jgi:hypothetical protein
MLQCCSDVVDVGRNSFQVGGRSKLWHSLDARPARSDIDEALQPGTALFSLAIFEAARFALMCHFLCAKDLLSGQAFGNDVSVFGRQLTVFVAR